MGLGIVEKNKSDNKTKGRLQKRKTEKERRQGFGDVETDDDDLTRSPKAGKSDEEGKEIVEQEEELLEDLHVIVNKTTNNQKEGEEGKGEEPNSTNTIATADLPAPLPLPFQASSSPRRQVLTAASKALAADQEIVGSKRKDGSNQEEEEEAELDLNSPSAKKGVKGKQPLQSSISTTTASHVPRYPNSTEPSSSSSNIGKGSNSSSSSSAGRGRGNGRRKH